MKRRVVLRDYIVTKEERLVNPFTNTETLLLSVSHDFLFHLYLPLLKNYLLLL